MQVSFNLSIRRSNPYIHKIRAVFQPFLTIKQPDKMLYNFFDFVCYPFASRIPFKSGTDYEDRRLNIYSSNLRNNMQKDSNMPLWVFLAFSSIETRRGAVILIWSSLLFTLYCIPWVIYYENPWVAKLFLIDDWEWFALMVPMTLWYWLSMKWVDKNRGWNLEAAAERNSIE